MTPCSLVIVNQNFLGKYLLHLLFAVCFMPVVPWLTLRLLKVTIVSRENAVCCVDTIYYFSNRQNTTIIYFPLHSIVYYNMFRLDQAIIRYYMKWKINNCCVLTV
jgi:hypothetical protein